MDGKICISCKRKVLNDPGSVSFPCPHCTKYLVIRCSTCRKSAIRYRCPQCSFEGPN